MPVLIYMESAYRRADGTGVVRCEAMLPGDGQATISKVVRDTTARQLTREKLLLLAELLQNGVPDSNGERRKLRHIEILGKYGTQYELASIAMHAVVGIVPEAELKNLRLSEAEVAEVFTVPVRFFAETEPYIYEQDIVQDTAGFPYEMLGIRSDYKWRVGHKQIVIYRYEDKIIWGLTASFVRHLVEELGITKF